MKLLPLMSITLGCLLGAFSSMAQQQKATLSTAPIPTLEQYTPGNPQSIRPQYIRGLQWLGSEYIYLDGENLISGKVNRSRRERNLLSLVDLISILPQHSSLVGAKTFPSPRVIGKARDLLLFSDAESEYIVDPRRKQLLARFSGLQGSEERSLSPQLDYIAYVRQHNVYIASSEGRELAITSDGKPTLLYGTAVHQNEFGIDKGLFWSPDGRKLAFYRMDQSMVEPYPILHIDKRKPWGEEQYYPMAGMPIHHVSLGVYDLDTQETIYLHTGEASQTYLTNVAWSPDSKELYVAEVSRDQKRSELNVYRASDGGCLRTLFIEQNARYIEPQSPARFVPLRPDLFVWQSRKDGWMHLYLYDVQGRLIRQLTQGEWEVVDFIGFSPDGKELYYTSTASSPLDRKLYSISLSGGNPQLITPELGWHTPQLSPDGHHVIDSYEAPDVPRIVQLVRTQEAQVIRTLLKAPNPEVGYATPQIELGTILAEDGKTPLHYRLIKPVHFDPSKKYPTIIYVYNGPHAQLVQHRLHGGARGWDRYMASQGFVVFTMDGRGSAYRGAEFEQIIHRQLGKHEMADQMQGVAYLRSLPYVDADRLGVYGWSYGGFMATNLMLTYPDVFKVGVAGGAVMDWSRYEAMYGERYMDTPQDNAEGYEANNLLRRASDLRGRLLLIHGTIDPVVIWQHSLLFMDAAIKAGSYPDYMVYPEYRHNVVGADRVHLNRTISRYFQDHL